MTTRSWNYGPPPEILAGQGLPRSTVKALGDRGIDAEHVGQLGMATASDEEILEAARARDAVVVTLDADFHSLLAAAHAINRQSSVFESKD